MMMKLFTWKQLVSMVSIPIIFAYHYNKIPDEKLKENLQEAKSSVYEILNLIHQRYELEDNYFLQIIGLTMNLNNNAWNQFKYKIMMKTLSEDAVFTMVFGGSSVTAGHDNYYNQSYPNVFFNRMNTSFHKIGIKLVVNNIAQGANDCLPFNLCYVNGGLHPDWIGWEQSFNCGRDQSIYEIIARTALSNHAIAFFMASGGYHKNCPKSTDNIPYMNENWSPDSIASRTQSKAKYNPVESDVDDFKSMLNKYFDNGNAVAKFTHNIISRYPGIGAHGFSIWSDGNSMCYLSRDEIKTKCTTANLMEKIPCQSDGGPSFMTYELLGKYANGIEKSHHPSIGLHQFRADVMAYIYSHILLDAISGILLSITTINTLKADLTEKLLSSQPQQIVLPKNCPPELCKYQANCFNSYQPHFEPTQTLEAVIKNKTVDWNLSAFALTGCDKSNNPFGYADCRLALTTNGPNKEIEFLLNIYNSDTYTFICGNANLLHVSLSISDQESNRYKDVFYEAWIKNCIKFRNVLVGKHVLRIRSSSTALMSDHLLITHIITY